jgi:AcrR family transcriptional regulator
VVSTALRMFGELGTLDVPMDDIAAQAGVARSTIYNHFSDRAELLSACAEWSYANLATAMKKSLERDAEPVDLVTGFFEAVFTVLDENPGLHRLATSLRTSSSEAEAYFDLELLAASSVSREQVNALVDRLHAAVDLPSDRAETLRWIGLVLEGSLQRRALTSAPQKPSVEAGWVADLLLNGLLPRTRSARKVRR